MSLELIQPTGSGSGGSPAAERAQARPARQGRLAWWLAQARAQPLAAVGAAIVLVWVLVAIFAPVIAPYSYKHVVSIQGCYCTYSDRREAVSSPQHHLGQSVSANGCTEPLDKRTWQRSWPCTPRPPTA